MGQHTVKQQDIMLQGSFSFINDNTTVFQIDDHTQGRITRLDNTVAGMYFMTLNENGDYVATAVPPNLALRESLTRVPVPVFQGSMFIAWTASYELMDGANIVLSLDVQRQQAIRTQFETYLICWIRKNPQLPCPCWVH